MNTLKLSKYWHNSGFCRIEYTYRSENFTFAYCLQDEGDRWGGVKLYKCSKDFEPSHETKFTVPVSFERPPITDELTRRVNEWIDKNGAALTVMDKINKL